MPLPGVANHRLVVLNTVFFSPNYTDRCGKGRGDPGKKQLAWLERTLDRARVEGKSVWLLMHIPFGIDVFSTLQQGRANVPVEFWLPGYSDPFFALMRLHESRVRVIFSGHIHMDTFRILRGPDDQPIVFNHVAPAISPVYGNNPGYQIFRYRRKGGIIADYATFYLANLTAGNAEAPGQWKQEYAFNQAYGLNGVDKVTLQQLARKVATNPAISREYARFYNVSHTSKPAVSSSNIKTYACALAHVVPARFDECRHPGNRAEPAATDGG